MRSSLLVLASFMTVFGAVVQAQEPLPDDVARLYIAYQEAEASGDLAVTLSAADAVYRAARRARVDDVTLGTLAENLGYYASASQDFERAYEAWRSAAERAQRAGAEGTVTGYRWQNAAVAAFQLGDHDDARRCAMNASDGFAATEDLAEEALETAVQAHVFAAQLSAGRGQIRIAGRSAERALSLFQVMERQHDRFTALSFFYAGLGALARHENLDAAVKLHLAYDLFAHLNAGDDEIGASRALSGYARRSLLREVSSDRESSRYQLRAERFDAEMEAALTAYPLHAEFAVLHEETPEPRILPEGTADTYPLRRAEPSYPSQALYAGIEGFVAIRFDVNEEGRVVDPEIIFSVPSGVFDESSLNAVSRWRYEPATVNGEPVRREGVETQFNFELSN